MRPADDWSPQLALPVGWLAIEPSAKVAARRRALARGMRRVIADQPDLGPSEAWMLHVAEGLVSNPALDSALLAAVGFGPIPGGEVGFMSLAGYGIISDTPTGLDLLVAELGQPQPDDVEERDTGIVSLPTGPAVRSHYISQEAPGTGAKDWDLAVERVDYAIPAPNGTDFLLLVFTTPSIAVGEVAVEVFDAIAETVTFIPVPGAGLGNAPQ